MSKDFSMFRFYKGEKENPYSNETQNTEHMFWFYESIFARDFAEKDSSEWYKFFGDIGMGDKFMAILTEADYNKPLEDKKKQVFELWLEYLFTYKLYPEYGGENTLKDLYYKSTAR